MYIYLNVPRPKSKTRNAKPWGKNSRRGLALIPGGDHNNPGAKATTDNGTRESWEASV